MEVFAWTSSRIVGVRRMTCLQSWPLFRCVFTYFTRVISTERANALTAQTPPVSSDCSWVNHSVTFPPQSLLDEPNPNSPANSQAAQLYQENKREYEKRVSAIVEQSWRDSWPHTPSLRCCLVEMKYLLVMGLFKFFLCTLLLVQDHGFVFLVHNWVRKPCTSHFWYIHARFPE